MHVYKFTISSFILQIIVEYINRFCETCFELCNDIETFGKKVNLPLMV